MTTERFSISLPKPLAYFISDYQAQHACRNRSEVIQCALKLLRSRDLEKAYHQANKETDDAFDIALADGLSDEKR